VPKNFALWVLFIKTHTFDVVNTFTIKKIHKFIATYIEYSKGA
jgi:hypothetical protein